MCIGPSRKMSQKRNQSSNAHKNHKRKQSPNVSSHVMHVKQSGPKCVQVTKGEATKTPHFGILCLFYPLCGHGAGREAHPCAHTGLQVVQTTYIAVDETIAGARRVNDGMRKSKKHSSEVPVAHGIGNQWQTTRVVRPHTATICKDEAHLCRKRVKVRSEFDVILKDQDGQRIGFERTHDRLVGMPQVLRRGSPRAFRLTNPLLTSTYTVSVRLCNANCSIKLARRSEPHIVMITLVLMRRSVGLLNLNFSVS